MGATALVAAGAGALAAGVAVEHSNNAREHSTEEGERAGGTCRHGHGLRHFRRQSASFGCDGCGKSCREVVGCRSCDFDLCGQCHNALIREEKEERHVKADRRRIVDNESSDDDDSDYESDNESQREKRLNSKVRTLYHMTDKSSAKAILTSEKFLRGSDGLAGGGIYFATNCSDCIHKSKASGKTFKIIETRVRLGKVKKLSSSGDRSITFSSLQREGYDSVLIPRKSGNEYVIYNSDQAKPLRFK